MQQGGDMKLTFERFSRGLKEVRFLFLSQCHSMFKIISNTAVRFYKVFFLTFNL